ncbi:hypothetical protein T459_34621 [Capsicum annuum]|uniref:Uncharacterized protein n=1 Tax=Capsicum annuum TaxID=4072 RepID=A0A2G2XVJ9_CAPAN|nr:hypothetical protein T459_34621 [Capsicum annuum]
MVTRSYCRSSSSSPPTADGLRTGTPIPSPQCQSFSRSYGSILQTSLAYIVPLTRGLPEVHRTPGDVQCSSSLWTLPPVELIPGWAGYLTKKITLPEAPADGSKLPNIVVDRHVLVILPDTRWAIAATTMRVELKLPLSATSVDLDSYLGHPRARGALESSIHPTIKVSPMIESRYEGATRCVIPRQTCPRPNGFGRNLRSNTLWFTGFYNSQQVSYFATSMQERRYLLPRVVLVYKRSIGPPDARDGRGARGILLI